jgi:hypothetical protein
MEANSKFRVGDLVRVGASRSSMAGVACVVKATNSGMQLPYFVESVDRSCGNWFSESELTLVKPAPAVTNNPEIPDDCKETPAPNSSHLGQIIEVRNYEDADWQRAELEAVFPRTEFAYVARVERNTRDFPTNWRYGRLVQAASNTSEIPNSCESAPVEPEVLTPAKTLHRVLYLAGPMRGVAFYNFPMFDRVAAALRDVGYEVINPADEDRNEDNFDPTLQPQFADPANCVVQPGMDFSKIIRRCFEAVMRCDEIVLLPGWENSVGAIAELFIAVWSGKRIQLVSLEENDQMQFVSTPAINLATAISRLQHARNETKQSEKSDDEDVLDIAARITRGDRQAVYGPPEQDFKKTADMWTGLFQYMLAGEAKFEPRHVAMALICMKMSREFHQRKKDNWVDIAGYARCGSLCE